MFNDWYWQLLYADGYSWEASGGNMFTDLLLGVFWQVTLGFKSPGTSSAAASRPIGSASGWITRGSPSV